MNQQAKFFLEPPRQLGILQMGLSGTLLIEEGQYGSRQFVGPVGTGFLWNQSCQTALLERCLGLIKGGPGQPGFAGRTTDWGAFGGDAPQHLVLDLDQIVGIEEVAFLKECGRDGLGMRMEDALLAEGTAFGGLARGPVLGRVHM